MNELQTTLIAKANQEHALAEHYAVMAIDHAYNCGLALMELKEQVGHGNWLKCFEDGGLKMERRQATRYMKYAENYELLPNGTHESHLPLRTAIALLSTPDEIREELNSKIESGETLTEKQIKEIVAKAKAEARAEAMEESKEKLEALQRRMESQKKIMDTELQSYQQTIGRNNAFLKTEKDKVEQAKAEVICLQQELESLKTNPQLDALREQEIADQVARALEQQKMAANARDALEMEAKELERKIEDLRVKQEKEVKGLEKTIEQKHNLLKKKEEQLAELDKKVTDADVFKMQCQHYIKDADRIRESVSNLHHQFKVLVEFYQSNINISFEPLKEIASRVSSFDYDSKLVMDSFKIKNNVIEV